MSDATALATRLREEGLDAGSWSNGAHDTYAAHEHGYDKVLVCASGSIRFGLPGLGLAEDLAVGDRLELPAGTVHDAVVGPEGVLCLEAHLPRGTFTAVRRLPSGAW